MARGEFRMRVCRVGLLMLGVLGVTLGHQANGGQGRGAAAATAILPYKLMEWPTLPTSTAGVPAGPWNFIQVASVAVTARGSILVLHRGAHPIIEFDSTGKLLRSWGDGMFSEGKVGAIPEAHWTADKSHYSAVYGPAGCTSCGAHSVRVDPQGNIWLIDAPGHVIYKMNPEGKEIMRLGTKGVAGTGANNFNLPTDVAFAAERRSLRQRRVRQRPSGEVLTRRKISVAMGQERQGSRRVRTAPQPGDRRTGQGVRHRSRQPANPGV